MRTKVLVIVGPTASGKSDLAVKLAQRFDGEVISADSRQVYKGLDIGTGKITQDEMGSIPHHMLDIADPRTRFSVSDYQKLGSEILRKIINKGKLPIVTGGTGLYIDALSCDINFPNVPPNPILRKSLGEKRLEELLEILDEKDPIRAQEVDRKNKPRVIRALEIVEVLGQVPKMKLQDSAHEFVYIGLKVEKEELEKKISKRLEKRLEGIIEECKKLHQEGLSWERMHELGLEYRYTSLHLQKKITEEELESKLFVEIKKYAKRQMTWFKRNENIRWFTLSSVEGFKPEDYEEIEKYANMALNKGD